MIKIDIPVTNVTSWLAKGHLGLQLRDNRSKFSFFAVFTTKIQLNTAIIY
jgi:hypothetical protein